MIRNITPAALWNLAAVAVIFLTHLPFLTADPDIDLCCSRDAFNAEGLNSFQIRNYLNQGIWSWYEGDNLVKMPLFSFLLFLPLKIFGTHLVVARLTVLLSILLCLVMAAHAARWKFFLPVISAFVLLQYHVFLYSHLVMSEMAGAGLMVVAVAFLVKSVHEEKSRKRNLFLSCLFSFLCFFLKMQFAYVLALVPLTLLFLRMTRLGSVQWAEVAAGFIFSGLLILLYFLAWYWPHREFINYMLAYEAGDKLPTLRQAIAHADWNFSNVFLAPPLRYYMVACLLLIFAGFVQMFRTKNSAFITGYVAGAGWLLLELHRLGFSYFPPRYQVSLIFAFGFLASLVVSESLLTASSAKWRKILTATWIAVSLLFHSADYLKVYSQRRFVIREMNEYLTRQLADPAQTVLGTWATAITWQSKARSVPVWNHFLNHEKTMEKFRPQIIVTEPGESDSNGAYRDQGVNVEAITDSLRTWKVSYWTIEVRWVAASARN